MSKMNNYKFENREFYFVIASDIIRDGIGVELWEIKTSKEIHLAEIFRNDNKRKVEFTANVKELPFKVIEIIIKNS